MKTANANGSTIILANDPDADRLALAEKQPEYVLSVMILYIVNHHLRLMSVFPCMHGSDFANIHLLHYEVGDSKSDW